MRTTSDARLLALHGARLRGFGEAADIGAVVGLEETIAARELEALAVDGLVQRRAGAPAGWVLTDGGRAEQERLLGAELDAAGCRGRVEDVYAAFGPVNRELLGACTDWQLRGGRTNDHADPVHDGAAVARLVRVHEAAQPLLAELEACLARFGGYRARLGHALERVQAGDTEWFTRPVLDSYHTVWFQLHEDLLNTLGRDRVDETGEDEE